MNNIEKLDKKWQIFFEREQKKDYYKKIKEHILNDIKGVKTIFPPLDDIFNRFWYTDFDNLKVVILGQDPYHWVWEAHWLSFSVKDWVKIPPSLKNIFKELKSDLWLEIPLNWDLTPWTKKWVLLLNSILTVVKDIPASHSKIWWQNLTDNVIKYISDNKENIVFILWWNYAKSKIDLIDNKKHFIIISPHPSPFSAYNWFFGSKPFSKANEFLKSKWIEKIDWII